MKFHCLFTVIATSPTLFLSPVLASGLKQHVKDTCHIRGSLWKKKRDSYNSYNSFYNIATTPKNHRALEASTVEWVLSGNKINVSDCRSVSLSRDGLTVAVGQTNFDNDRGRVLIYRYINGSWTQIGIDIIGEGYGDTSGNSMSLSENGNTIAIGARAAHNLNGSQTGHTRVYQYIDGVWVQLGSDIDGEGYGDRSGHSVSLSYDGNTVAIGAYFNYGDGGGWGTGHVRVYQFTNNSWAQVGSDINGEEYSGLFGKSVSLSGDASTLAIGAHENDGNGVNSGHARVYKYVNGVWVQLGSDIDGEASYDQSGWEVSLSRDASTLAISAPYNDANGVDSGHTKVYKFVDGTWVQLGSNINGDAAGDLSGHFISLSGDASTLAIGALYNDSNGSSSGHVRIYKFVNDTWVQVGSDINGEDVDDEMGFAVSLSYDGNTVACLAKVSGTSIYTLPTVTTTWFINEGVISLVTDGTTNPQIIMTHDVGYTGFSASLEVTLFKNDCSTTVATGDAVSIVFTSLNGNIAEYTIEVDKELVANSTVLVNGNELDMCVMAKLKDVETNTIRVQRTSKIEATFDLSNIGFFTEVSGQSPSEYGLDPIVGLYTVSSCICSFSYECDEVAPLMTENTLISVCLWPSAPGLSFTEFNMTIAGKNNNFEYNPIEVVGGTQIPDPSTTMKKHGQIWKITTQLFSGLFEEDVSQAEISGYGRLEFVDDTKDEESYEEDKDFLLLIPLDGRGHEDEGSLFSCISDLISTTPIFFDKTSASTSFSPRKKLESQLQLPSLMKEKASAAAASTRSTTNNKNNLRNQFKKVFSSGWDQVGSDIQPVGMNGDGDYFVFNFGFSVATSDDSQIVAIGSPITYNFLTDETMRGIVQVFDGSTGEWMKKGSDITGTDDYDFFGYSLDISAGGDAIAINSPFRDNYTGLVQVYKYMYDWEQLGNDITGGGELSYFGFGLSSVALSADAQNLIVGSPYTNDFKGIVHAFSLDTYSSTWNMVASVEGVASNDMFGYSLDATSDASTIIISAPGHDGGKGLVQAYQGESVVGSITGDNADEFMGTSVSLSEDVSTVAILSPGFDNEKGLLQVYKNDELVGSVTGDDLDGSMVSVKVSKDASTVAVCTTEYVHVFKYSSNSWEQAGGNLIIYHDIESESGGVPPVALSKDGNTIVKGYPVGTSANCQR